MEAGADLSLGGKLAVNEANLRDEYYWKLVADFIGPQSGEGLELEEAPCKNRLLIQVGLFLEDNNFPWIAILSWLKKIFPSHHSADFRCLIERGIATTLSLGSDARQTFLESVVNFNFVGPICDSIGVERQHLLEMRDFSERAQLIEVTNGLILELSNFVTREKIAPVMLVSWLKNFDPDFCKNGNIQRAYKELNGKMKRLKLHYRNCETRRHRRNAVMEHLLQSPFELVEEKPKVLLKKPMKINYKKVTVKEEYESYDVTQGEGSEMNGAVGGSDEDLGTTVKKEKKEKEISDKKAEALTLLEIAILSVQKLSKVYGGKTAACKQVSLDLLRNQYTLTCKEHPAMTEFENKLDSLCEDISLASPVVFLNLNANFLVDMHDAIEQQIMNFEKEIIMSTGERLGRDKLPQFKCFVNMSESATSRYIHMACDILNPCPPATSNYRKHWLAFCEEKINPSKLAVHEANKFNSYFEAAAGLIHHHKETALFFSDLLSMTDDERPNIILESVAADANDSVLQSFVCVLAIVYCKVIGPYWQLLNSGAEYSRFSVYMLSLYQRFLDWSKDPSLLLEADGFANVFQQFPLQEKTFDGVFYFCGQWHTNKGLIRVCLKRLLKVMANVTEEHLKDFLPGGMYSQALSSRLSGQLVSCTFSVLMAEYPFSHPYPEKKEEEEASRDSDSSQEDNARSGSSDEEKPNVEKPNEDGNSPPTKKLRRVKEEPEDIMDMDYIVATVKRNGGPCSTQTDVDKLLLRYDGKSRLEKREAVRCEILYQKLVLNNTDSNLNCPFKNSSTMSIKLKIALPRIKPGFSLVLAPRRTQAKPVRRQQHATEVETGPSESVITPTEGDING